MTSSRHDQAAARSTPYGTSARLKFEVPAAITIGSGSCSRSWRRIAAHWWASREATPSLWCSSLLAMAPSLPSSRPAGAPSVVAHRVNLSTTLQQARHEAVRRVGVLGGQQPGRGQHVVGVDDDPGALGQLPVAVTPTLGPSTRSATPARPWRSTPPEPTTRSTSRRSTPVRSTTRPSGLTTTFERPAWRRRARATAARAMASSSSCSASVVGRKPGSSRLRAGGLLEVGQPGLLDRGDRRPAHPEVALDGAGDRGGRDHVAGELRLLGVDLDHRVHVGGGAADVDDHDLADRPGQQLDAGQDDVGGGAADHGR